MERNTIKNHFQGHRWNFFGTMHCHAARALIKPGGYSAFAILTLGLGIGANVECSMFSDGCYLRDFLFPRSFELVEIDRRSTSTQPSGRGLSWSMYLEYVNAQPNALPELAGYYPFLAFEIGHGNQNCIRDSYSSYGKLLRPVTGARVSRPGHQRAGR